MERNANDRYLNLTSNTIMIQEHPLESFLQGVSTSVCVSTPPPLYIFPPLENGAITLVREPPTAPAMTVCGIGMQWLSPITDVHCPIPIRDAEGIIVPIEVAEFIAHGRHTLLQHITKCTGQLNVFAIDPQRERRYQSKKRGTIVMSDRLVVHTVLNLNHKK